MNNDTPFRASPGSLDWLLESLVVRVSGVQNAVVLSVDGLLLAGSSGLEREAAEHLSALCSALHSLGRGVGSRFGRGQLHQTIVELELGYLVVATAGDGACLAVFSSTNADLGLVTYEMNVIVDQVGEHLRAVPRTPRSSNAPHVS